MATVGEVRQQLTTRMRSHFPEALEIRMISHAQRIANCAIRRILVTTPLTVDPHRLIMDLRNLIPNYVFVFAVRDQERDLDFMKDWRELARADRHWFRAVGPQFESFSLISRDLLVLYPALEFEHTVDVVCVKHLAPLQHDLEVLELGDEFIPLVVDLAEALLNIRERRHAPVVEAFQRFASRVEEARRV